LSASYVVRAARHTDNSVAGDADGKEVGRQSRLVKTCLVCGAAQNSPAPDHDVPLASHVCLPVLDLGVMTSVNLQDDDAAIGEPPLAVQVPAAPGSVTTDLLAGWR